MNTPLFSDDLRCYSKAYARRCDWYEETVTCNVTGILLNIGTHIIYSYIKYIYIKLSIRRCLKT